MVTSREFYHTLNRSSLTSTDTRKTRKGRRKGTETARVTKIVAARNVNAPPARKKKVKTKNESGSGSGSGRGNQTERKEMLRSVYLTHSL